MKDITNLLLNDEKMLWEHIKSLKFDFRHRLSGIILIGIIFNVFFLIYFWTYLLPYFHLLYFILIVPLMINSIFILGVFLELYATIRDKKIGQLRWKDLKKYTTIVVLTNKRWIQKDLKVIHTKNNKSVIERIEHYKDIVFIKLEFIKLIQITEFKEIGKWKYWVSLYLSYDKTGPKKNYLGVHFTSKIRFQNLLENLKALFQ